MAINQRTLEETLAKFNQDHQDAKESSFTNSLMQQISSMANKLNALKMVQALAPASTMLSANNPYFNPIMATAMASNAFKNPGAHLNQMNQYNQLKGMRSVERKIQYDNAWGDSAARTSIGLNNVGSTVGITGSLVKAAGMAGYMPDVLHGVNPLTLMGLMQGGKGTGTLAAGLMGGPGSLGSMIGAGAAGGMPAALMGTMAMLAMNMAGGKLNSAMLNAGSFAPKKFRADVSLSLQNGHQLELEHSSMVQISSQIKMMTNQNMLSPGEALHANILMLIESHTSVLGPILAELRNADEIKNKSGGNAGQNVANDMFGEDGLMTLRNQRGTTRQPNIFQRGLAKFAQTSLNLNSIVDIFGQIGNTLSGKSSVALFNDANRKQGDADANQEFSNKFGVSVTFTQIIHTSASEVLDKANTFEAKQISILAGVYELNRFQAHELLSIRRDGLGVDRPGHTGELARMRLQEADSPVEDSLLTMIDEMLGYIPLWHTISGSAKMVMAGYENVKEMVTGGTNPFKEMFKAIGRSITGTFSTVDHDEGSLRATIGATKLSPSELMARYLSGDYIKQMTLLVNFNREQAHYLKYLANAEARKRGGRGAFVSGPDHGEETTLDEFSGNLITSAQRRKRDNDIGRKLGEHLNSTQPQGLMGLLLAPFMSNRSRGAMSERVAIEDLGHVSELYNQFGNTRGYRAGRVAGRGFAKGTGDTGKAAPGTSADHTGEKPVGVVHENEAVVPGIDKKPSWFRSILNSMLPSSSPKAKLTSTETANLIHSKEVQESDHQNNLIQTETQTGMLGYLKKIFGVNEEIAKNTKKDPKKGGDWELADLMKLIALGAGLATMIAYMDDIKKFLGEQGLALAAIASVLGLKNILTKLPILGAMASGAKGAIMNAAAGTAMGRAAGIHGPALPPMNLADKIKTMAGSAVQSGKEALGKGNAFLSGGLKAAGRAGLMGAAITGAFEFFTQDDLNVDGTPKSFWDKLKFAGEKVLGQTGTLIGGAIGMGLGAMTPVPGGALIGSIAGGLLGDYIQTKVVSWWDNYGKAKPTDKPLSFKDKAIKFLSSNVGAMIGGGIGVLIGTPGGPIGMTAGGIIGAILGDKVQTAVGNIVDGLSADKWDITKALGGVADIGAGMIGAKLGFAIGGPMGALLGGVLTMLLWDGAKALWDKVTVDNNKPISNAETRAVMDASLQVDKMQSDLATLKNSRTLYANNPNLSKDQKAKILKGIDNAIKIKEGELSAAQDSLSKLNSDAYNKYQKEYTYGAKTDKFFTEKVLGRDGKELRGDKWAINRLMSMKFSEAEATSMIREARAQGMSPTALLAITSQEAGGKTKAINSNNKNGTIDYGMYQFNGAARLTDLSRRPELREDLKRLGIQPGNGNALGKAMLGDPILQTKIMALDYKSRGGNITKYIKGYNPYDVKGTNQKFWNLNEANKHYDGELITTPPTPVPDNKQKTSTAKIKEQVKEQAQIQKDKQDMSQATHRELIEKIDAQNVLIASTNQQLAVSNEYSAAQAEQLAKLRQDQEQAKTLWDYIETVYKAPQFNDLQFAPILAR